MSTQPTIAIVGGESLIGRELREVMREQRLPARVQLIGVDEDSLTLTEQDGEAAIITPLDGENLQQSQVAFLAGSASSSRKVLAMIARFRNRPVLIDMTYVAEEEPSARLRAPLVELEGHGAPPGALHIIAHPAAIALAVFLLRLDAEFRIRRSVVHVCEPASERGQRGLDELRQQTVNLLSFQSLPKAVFDAQLGFNLLASYGSEAAESLQTIEQRIERHLASLLAGHGGPPMPSLRLIQAPVFHGYGISAHVEFDSRPEIDELSDALSAAEIDVRAGDLEPPDNAGIAGQSGIAVGAILADRNHPNACWFWVVADNFRLMADNGVAVARPLLPAAFSGEAE